MLSKIDLYKNEKHFIFSIKAINQLISLLFIMIHSSPAVFSYRFMIVILLSQFVAVWARYSR